ncbi:transcription antitermination factor NusB [Ectobacillus antri]|jgi:N utilization substance protein B|uniref:Transcription antitermination protein NusB n=1 Tax=Ectobacillus antri TaxID=2486280 RepID=A0ABT6H1S0_9BACI|nr:transcription antitermination factor NusB [Ectobacillus antri]MDG4655602.1 transcription antitermination factor NusB [Ectobacillus antri]MDG5753360.1 transcription antitermination factor NusB [Ectobacillus antri]
MKRRKAREKAMQALYQMDITSELDAMSAIKNTLEEQESNNEFLEKLVTGCTAHKEELDALIAPSLDNWKMDRIGIVDRNILRIAVYEMKYMEDIPHSVSINEAIEVAKTFGDEESRRFINGVLSKIKETI